MVQKVLRSLKFLVPFAILYGALCLVLALLQRSMIYLPTPLSNTSAQYLELSQADATIRVAIHAHSGSRAVLYFGGNAEDVSYSLPELSQVFPQAAIYAMHYRGYSGSTGSPSEQALHSDALALYERVARDHSEIIVVGRSLGSGLAVPLAARRKVDRLVLVTPFDSMVNVAKYHYPLVPVNLLLLERYESCLESPKIRTPTLILIAESDAVVPRKCTMNLVQSFPPGVCQAVVLPNTDHNTLALPATLIQQFMEGTVSGNAP